MSKFKGGDYVRRVDPRYNEGVRSRRVTEVVGTQAPETFRAVFCAWQGQPCVNPAPSPVPLVTPLQEAKLGLFNYVQRPAEITGKQVVALVDRIVAEAKAEALALGVDVRAAPLARQKLRLVKVPS